MSKLIRSSRFIVIKISRRKKLIFLLPCIFFLPIKVIILFFSKCWKICIFLNLKYLILRLFIILLIHNILWLVLILILLIFYLIYNILIIILYQLMRRTSNLFINSYFCRRNIFTNCIILFSKFVSNWNDFSLIFSKTFA